MGEWLVGEFALTSLERLILASGGVMILVKMQRARKSNAHRSG